MAVDGVTSLKCPLIGNGTTSKGNGIVVDGGCRQMKTIVPSTTCVDTVADNVASSSVDNNDDDEDDARTLIAGRCTSGNDDGHANDDVEDSL